MPASSRNQTILIVEDDPISLKLLDSRMKSEGFRTLTAENAEKCLKILQQTKPDLILSDFMMPQMDGPELCTAIKKNPDYHNIPIILVTARADTESKNTALAAGAVDYITKPIDFKECLARVNTHLHVKEVNEKNLELNLRLAEIRKEASIGAVTQGITHNLNNMLAHISLCNESILTHSKDPQKVEKNSLLIAKTLKRLVSINRQLQATLETQKPVTEEKRLLSIVQGAIEQFRQKDKSNIAIILTPAIESIDTLRTNTEHFEKIILELLKNARESYPKEILHTHQITLDAAVRDLTNGHFVEVQVIDEGRGIRESVQSTIFEPFVSTKETVGNGLGLTIAKHMTEQLGGQLKLDPNPKGGTIATFSHPI